MSRAARVQGAVPAPLLQRVLQPYRKNVHYVLDASFAHPAERCAPRPDDPSTWVEVDGRCSISGSCYIDDTGHFNAVELNITYNQLLYTGLAAIAAHDLLADLPWNLDDFFVHQLPDVLIIDYHARFRRPLTARAFSATFAVTEVIRKPHKDMVLLRTTCQARCDHEGDASADVMIALVHVNARG